MFRSVGHAVAAMLRYQERQRSARSAPWPDHAPGAASVANRWNYVYVRSLRPTLGPEGEDDRDPLTVVVLFSRHDRRRYLTRLLVERIPLKQLPGQERRRARRAVSRFARDLCSRGLLENPPKGCPGNVPNEFPSCRPGCRARCQFSGLTISG